MRRKKSRGKPLTQPKETLVKTNLLDLIGALIDLRTNDAVLIASIMRIFDNCNVRLLRSPARVRLVASK
jgi:hypothetical protein